MSKKLNHQYDYNIWKARIERSKKAGLPEVRWGTEGSYISYTAANAILRMYKSSKNVRIRKENKTTNETRSSS